MKTTWLLSFPLTTLLLACPNPQAEVAPAAQPAAEQAVAAVEQPAAPAHAPAAEHDCAEGTTQLTDDTVTTRTDAQGRTVTHAGAAFGEATPVSVAELLGSPDAFAGKKVRVKGSVSAMCHHRRGWFAVVGDDKSGQTLRVLTQPAFLVPAGSIGKLAEAEGTVEVIEVAADHARHLAAEHKLGDPEQITASVKQVVIRATGADFI